jgi:hypothetical protein
MAFGQNQMKMLKTKKKGELIEPLKPIVYYIDPATPEMEKIHQARY